MACPTLPSHGRRDTPTEVLRMGRLSLKLSKIQKLLKCSNWQSTEGRLPPYRTRQPVFMIFARSAAEEVWLMKKAVKSAMPADIRNVECEFIRIVNTNKFEFNF